MPATSPYQSESNSSAIADDLPPYLTTHPDDQDSKYLTQFRNVVWKQLVQAEPASIEANPPPSPSANVMEQVATSFKPLCSAIRAVGALSLAQQDGLAGLDALKYYQQALPALQTNVCITASLYSDGSFLTHFMLLVYEVAAAESGRSTLWAQHLSTLLQISLTRHEYFGGERYPYVTWWICNFDLYALLSGAGDGDFFRTMLKSNAISSPSCHLYPLRMDGRSVIYAEELPTLPIVLQFNYEITMIAVRLGLLSQELRKDITTDNIVDAITDAKLRQGRVGELQDAMRQLWASPAVANLISKFKSSENVPSRSKQLFERALSRLSRVLLHKHVVIAAYGYRTRIRRRNSTRRFTDHHHS